MGRPLGCGPAAARLLLGLEAILWEARGVGAPWEEVLEEEVGVSWEEEKGYKRGAA